MFNKPSPRLRPRMQAEVGKRIEDLAPGGGFVFAATQAIQSDTPRKPGRHVESAATLWVYPIGR